MSHYIPEDRNFSFVLNIKVGTTGSSRMLQDGMAQHFRRLEVYAFGNIFSSMLHQLAPQKLQSLTQNVFH